MRKIKFGLEGTHWPVEDIEKLGELLFKYSHRFSKDKMDLGYCTVDPFRIELKPETRPVKQRPYHHNPAVQKKVQVEIDRMLAAGILRRSYSNWSSSPLVVVTKADGSIRIMCNYKNLNDGTIIPVLPIPISEELLDELGGAKIFSCLDITSGYFNVAIHQDSIPSTAICTQSGLYEW
ncbi:unnamed protein product [Sphacelaria rigidula]